MSQKQLLFCVRIVYSNHSWVQVTQQKVQISMKKGFDRNYQKLLGLELDYNYAHDHSGDPETNYITREKIEAVAEIVRNVPTLKVPFMLMYEHYINGASLTVLAEANNIKREEVAEGIKIACLVVKAHMKREGWLDE